MSDLNDFLTSKEDENDKGLFVVHNITENNLIKTLNDFNGLIAPSLAVVNNKDLFNNFGEITLVFEPTVLFNGQKQVNKSDNINFLYTGDMYSIRFPEKEYDRNRKVKNDNLFFELKKFDEITDSDLSNFDFFVDSNYKSCFSYLQDLNSFRLLFLNKKLGEDFNFSPVVETIKIDNRNKLIRSPNLKKYLKRTDFDKGFDKEKLTQYLIEAKRDQLEALNIKYNEENEVNDQKNKDFFKRSKRSIQRAFYPYIDENNELKETSIKALTELSNQLRIPKKRVNVLKTRDKLIKIINDNDLNDAYNKYVEKTTLQFYHNPHIKYKNAKFEYNEDNILNVMKKNKGIAQEETLSFSLGKAKSLTNIRIFSLDDLYDRKDYIISKDEYDLIKDDNILLAQKFRYELLDINKHLDTFDISDLSTQFIGTYNNFKDYDEYINKLKNFDLNGNEKSFEIFKELSIKFRNSNVAYFESKPFRKVDETEIKHAVVPRSVDINLKLLLREKNIKLHFYKTNDPEDRLRAINKCNKEMLNQKYLNKINKSNKIKRNKIR